MENPQNIKINVSNLNEDIGKRLDLFLSLNLPQYSRAFIKKTIESNKVILNGEICFKAGYKVKSNDLIEFPSINYKSPSMSLEPSVFDLEIVFEDNDYLIINKPIGLTVHPTDSSQNNTMVNKLLARYKELPGDQLSRPGIVHRLDKDTSGLIAVAKSARGLWWLSSQFADRKVTKKYISIGIADSGLSKLFDSKEFEIQGEISRNHSNRKEFVLLNSNQSSNNSRFSLSKFNVIEKIQIAENKYLINFEIFPKTGRTHQIRVHQKSIGVPIIGDPIYLSRKQKVWFEEFIKNSKLTNRLYLHSHELSFENYDGKMYSFTTKVPQSFIEVLEYAKEIPSKQGY